LITLLSCRERKSKVEIYNVQESYQAPYFEDSLRVEKILKYKSVIDSIFAKSARANHNPSIAYGIVVDNKLIY
jgi:hypothetical protein